MQRAEADAAFLIAQHLGGALAPGRSVVGLQRACIQIGRHLLEELAARCLTPIDGQLLRASAKLAGKANAALPVKRRFAVPPTVALADLLDAAAHHVGVGADGKAVADVARLAWWHTLHRPMSDARCLDHEGLVHVGDEEAVLVCPLFVVLFAAATLAVRFQQRADHLDRLCSCPTALECQPENVHTQQALLVPQLCCEGAADGFIATHYTQLVGTHLAPPQPARAREYHGQCGGCLRDFNVCAAHG
mmetsp:Transcript_16116/g.37721  ORF Transcript_16116/g.37721 Transcript_16116/m.37721 type:complete len:247 (+) Transcript_16116:430-1170(+)